METKTELSPAEDFQGFFDEFQNESPRAAVIVGAAFLDAQLRKLLASFLIERRSAVEELLGSDKKTDRPLSAFSARIKAAYCLGLISEDEHDDLNLIRRVRNSFAHRLHDLSFEDKRIVSWCNLLQIPKGLPMDIGSHRDMFVIAVAVLSSQLGLRALQAAREQRVVPRGFRTRQVIRTTGEKQSEAS